ncbi:MAG: hypothetical protein LKJ90_08935 [Faecalibacterium sp.]|jgi:hypothetical protein|nr:hypothetical protein [Faecalibacterium sp.]
MMNKSVIIKEIQAIAQKATAKAHTDIIICGQLLGGVFTYNGREVTETQLQRIAEQRHALAILIDDIPRS